MEPIPVKEIWNNLFEQTFHVQPERYDYLPRSGSDRVYCRLFAGAVTAVGAYNPDIKENEAFFSFTLSFKQIGVHVPEILGIAPDRHHYLLSDLGNETLYDRIASQKKEGVCSATLCILKEVLAGLAKIQVEGSKIIDFNVCYPRMEFDKQSVLWDLNYFKYEFLKLTGTAFNEELLESDFNTLAEALANVPSTYFMYRDFQARNVMLLDNSPWFIDYQGGRRGPLQYDLASILFSPKTRLNPFQREALLNYYLECLDKKIRINRDEFKDRYYGFVLIRILQALGAYGFRGIFERKPHFRESIPIAIHNLAYLLDNQVFKFDLPEVFRIIRYLAGSKWANPYVVDKERLTVRISSFSFKKGIPDDPSDNGGGFVFDCRGLPNPGRYPEYKGLSGLDEEVVNYLLGFEEVAVFQESARSMVEITVKEYLARGFNHLCIGFGCTGGQHRSVYQAEKMAAWLKNNFDADVVILHTEKENWSNHGKKGM